MALSGCRTLSAFWLDILCETCYRNMSTDDLQLIVVAAAGRVREVDRAGCRRRPLLLVPAAGRIPRLAPSAGSKSDRRRRRRRALAARGHGAADARKGTVPTRGPRSARGRLARRVSVHDGWRHDSAGGGSDGRSVPSVSPWGTARRRPAGALLTVVVVFTRIWGIKADHENGTIGGFLLGGLLDRLQTIWTGTRWPHMPRR